MPLELDTKGSSLRDGPHIIASSCPSAPMSRIHCVFSNRVDLLFTSGRQPRETAVAYI